MWLIYSNKINTYEQQEAALRIISKYAVSALGGYQQVAWLRVISACIVETVMWVALSGIPIDTEKKRYNKSHAYVYQNNNSNQY